MTEFFGDPHYHEEAFQFKKVQMVDKCVSYQGFFSLDRYVIQHPLYAGGMSNQLSRELMERGDAVMVLPYDPKTDEVILIEQFRIGAYGAACRDQDQGLQPKSPWLIECIGGMVDQGRTALEVVHAEAQEEAGIDLQHVTSMMRLYTSPGGISERIEHFVAITESQHVKGIHGKSSENEDIRVLRVPLTLAMDWINEGKINNASTVISLQWLQLNKHSYLQQIDPMRR